MATVSAGVLISLAAITGKDPNSILVEMLQWAGPDRQIIDVVDGMMWRRGYTDYLEAHGWKGSWEPGPIPATCLVILDGHAFAVVDGVFYDNGALRERWGRKILATYTPPSEPSP